MKAKKLLALVLSLVLIVGLLPVTAMAAADKLTGDGTIYTASVNTVTGAITVLKSSAALPDGEVYAAWKIDSAGTEGAARLNTVETALQALTVDTSTLADAVSVLGSNGGVRVNAGDVLSSADKDKTLIAVVYKKADNKLQEYAKTSLAGLYALLGLEMTAVANVTSASTGNATLKVTGSTGSLYYKSVADADAAAGESANLGATFDDTGWTAFTDGGEVDGEKGKYIVVADVVGSGNTKTLDKLGAIAVPDTLNFSKATAKVASDVVRELKQEAGDTSFDLTIGGVDAAGTALTTGDTSAYTVTYDGTEIATGNLVNGAATLAIDPSASTIGGKAADMSLGEHTFVVTVTGLTRAATVKMTVVQETMPALSGVKVKGTDVSFSSSTSTALTAAWPGTTNDVSVTFANAQSGAKLIEYVGAKVNEQVSAGVVVKRVTTEPASGATLSTVWAAATAVTTSGDNPDVSKLAEGDSYLIVEETAPTGAADENGTAIPTVYYVIKATVSAGDTGDDVTLNDMKVKGVAVTDGSVADGAFAGDATLATVKTADNNGKNKWKTVDLGVADAKDATKAIFSALSSDGVASNFTAWLYTKTVFDAFTTDTISELAATGKGGTSLDTTTANMTALTFDNTSVDGDPDFYIVSHPNATSNNKYYVTEIKLVDSSAATVAVDTTSLTKNYHIAGTALKLSVTNAQDSSGQAYTGDVSFKITSYANDGTTSLDGVVYDSTSTSTLGDAKVTLTGGVGTITIPAGRMKTVDATGTKLEITSDEIKADGINSGNKLDVTTHNAAAAKLVGNSVIENKTVGSGAAFSNATITVTDEFDNPYLYIPETGLATTSKKVAAAVQGSGWTLKEQGTAAAEVALAPTGIATFVTLTPVNSNASQPTQATIRFTFDGSKTVYLDQTFTILKADSSEATIAFAGTNASKITADAGAGTYSIAISGAKGTDGVALNSAQYNVKLTRGDYTAIKKDTFNSGALAIDLTALTDVDDATVYPFLIVGTDPITVEIYGTDDNSCTEDPVVTNYTYSYQGTTDGTSLPTNVAAGAATHVVYTETGVPVGPETGSSTGAAFRNPPAVQVVDAKNNPVSGTFTVQIYPATGNWLLNADGKEAAAAVTDATKQAVVTVTTNASGVATFSDLKIASDDPVETAKLTFVLSGTGVTGSPVTDALDESFTIPGAGKSDQSAATLAIKSVRGNTSIAADGKVTAKAGKEITVEITDAKGVAGSALTFASANKVTVTDSLGDTVTVDKVSGASSNPNEIASATAGTGTFYITSGLKTVGEHTLTVTIAGIASTNINTLTLTVEGGDPAALKAEPKKLTASSTLGELEDFTVTVVDDAKNTVTSDNTTVITLELPSSAADTLKLKGEGVDANGLAKVAVVNGVATFSGMSIENLTSSAQSATLTASATGLTSDTIEVSVPIQTGDPADNIVTKTVADGQYNDASEIGEETTDLKLDAGTSEEVTLGSDVVDALTDNGVKTTVETKDAVVAVEARTLGEVIAANSDLASADGKDTVGISAKATSLTDAQETSALTEAAKEYPALSDAVVGSAYDVTLKINGKEATVENLKDKIELTFKYTGSEDTLLGVMWISGSKSGVYAPSDWTLKDEKLVVKTDHLTSIVTLTTDTTLGFVSVEKNTDVTGSGFTKYNVTVTGDTKGAYLVISSDNNGRMELTDQNLGRINGNVAEVTVKGTASLELYILNDGSKILNPVENAVAGWGGITSDSVGENYT